MVEAVGAADPLQVGVIDLGVAVGVARRGLEQIDVDLVIALPGSQLLQEDATAEVFTRGGGVLELGVQLTVLGADDLSLVIAHLAQSADGVEDQPPAEPDVAVGHNPALPLSAQLRVVDGLVVQVQFADDNQRAVLRLFHRGGADFHRLREFQGGAGLTAHYSLAVGHLQRRQTARINAHPLPGNLDLHEYDA